MFEKNNYNYLQHANRAGLLLVILFVICFVWFYFRLAEQGLHLQLLRLSFFGFNEMNGISFILGAIQSYVWGYVVVGIWGLVGSCCFKVKS